MDWSLPGFSVQGILQARTLEWVAVPFSRESSWPREWTQVSCTAGRLFTIWATKTLGVVKVIKPYENLDSKNPFSYIKNEFDVVQFSSVAQSCPTLCDPMNCSTPGLPVHHQLLESTQTHVHWVGDVIQPSHPLSSPSPALNSSQHQGLFKWIRQAQTTDIKQTVVREKVAKG